MCVPGRNRINSVVAVLCKARYVHITNPSPEGFSFLPEKDAFEAWSDGSKKHGRLAAYGVHYGKGNKFNSKGNLNFTDTNNAGELQGILHILAEFDETKYLIIYTDSQYSIDAIAKGEVKEGQTNAHLLASSPELDRLSEGEWRSHSHMLDGNRNSADETRKENGKMGRSSKIEPLTSWWAIERQISWQARHRSETAAETPT